jgi:hypothetical protein
MGKNLLQDEIAPSIRDGGDGVDLMNNMSNIWSLLLAPRNEEQYSSQRTGEECNY